MTLLNIIKFQHVIILLLNSSPSNFLSLTVILFALCSCDQVEHLALKNTNKTHKHFCKQKYSNLNIFFKINWISFHMNSITFEPFVCSLKLTSFSSSCSSSVWYWSSFCRRSATDTSCRSCRIRSRFFMRLLCNRFSSLFFSPSNCRKSISKSLISVFYTSRVYCCQ